MVCIGKEKISNPSLWNDMNIQTISRKYFCYFLEAGSEGFSFSLDGSLSFFCFVSLSDSEDFPPLAA